MLRRFPIQLFTRCLASGLLAGLPLGLFAGTLTCTLTGTARAQDAPTDLEARVAELERQLAERDKPTPKADPPAEVLRRDQTLVRPGGYWSIPGSDLVFKLGGYVKLDAIHDFNQIGNEFKFATQSIAVPGDDLSRTTMHPRETRLNFDLRGEVDGHDVRTFVEVDFFGTNGALNLRHAYGQLGGLLAGQTWSTYMDLSSRPHTLDFEGPDAELFVRQPMVRWSQPVEGIGSFSVALDDSGLDISQFGTFTGVDVTPLPDLAANLRLEGEGRHAQLSGVLRYLEFDGDAGTPDADAVGWGLALSGKTQVGDPGRRLMGQVSIGEGSSHYNQALRGAGVDAFLAANGDLQTLPVVSAVLGYEHDWSQRLSSTFAYSRANVDNGRGQEASTMHESQSASANLIWMPFDHFLTGVEYLYGTREDNDGSSGTAHRLQISFKFMF